VFPVHPAWSKSSTRPMAAPLTGQEEVRAANAMKNLLASAVSAMTVVVFVARCAVAWTETAIMLAGALAGGVAAAWIVAVVPAAVLCGFVIAAGSAMSVVYAWRYWVRRGHMVLVSCAMIPSAAAARARAAPARRRVESRVGSGELASHMTIGISVQPSTTASHPASFILAMTH